MGNKVAPLGVIPPEIGGKHENSRAEDQSKQVSIHHKEPKRVHPKTVRRIRKTTFLTLKAPKQQTAKFTSAKVLYKLYHTEESKTREETV